MEVVIYGAQGIALGAYKAIKVIHPEINILCFLVTMMGNNAHTLGGIRVRELKEFITGMSQNEKDNIKVLIGTPENLMEEIEQRLVDAGIYNIERLDSLRWSRLQEQAFARQNGFAPVSIYSIGLVMPKIKIFKMVHHRDKMLKTMYDDPSYVVRLQVGYVLADKTVAEFHDNFGDNISNRNGNYSELTGLYWIWKNYMQVNEEKNEYVGLAHYRRFLELSDIDMMKMQDNNIDVVLPYPMPYEPNIEVHHKRYLSDMEWDAVWQALEEINPEYETAFKEILKQEYMYNYNIIIAKSCILAKYCAWLFPILFRIEEIVDSKENRESNRYIGYIGETLETLYFLHNRGDLKIAHAGCRFLV